MANEMQQVDKKLKTRDHLANERTFLAWIRTSIGIMAFGFVVEKFALFIKKITYFLGGNAHQTPDVTSGGSSAFGIALVILGALICLLAFIKYKQNEKQIDSDSFKPSILLDLMLTLSVLSIGVFIAIYLFSNV
jgi:putative membrane protein